MHSLLVLKPPRVIYTGKGPIYLFFSHLTIALHLLVKMSKRNNFLRRGSLGNCLIFCLRFNMEQDLELRICTDCCQICSSHQIAASCSLCFIFLDSVFCRLLLIYLIVFFFFFLFWDHLDLKAPKVPGGS